MAELWPLGAAPGLRIAKERLNYAYCPKPIPSWSIAQRGRYLLRRRLITAHQLVLLDAMLWAARKPGSATLTASLRVLARMAGQARSTVTEGIQALEKLGLVQRIRRRVRVAWIGGGVASRQVANAYRMIVPDTETARRPTREEPLRIFSIGHTTTVPRLVPDLLSARRHAVERLLR